MCSYVFLVDRLGQQGFLSFSHPRVGLKSVSFQSHKKRSAIKASSSSDSAGPTAPIAPLQLESPIGQFLTQILVSHPHLVPSAVDQQQLEQLQTDRDAQEQNEEPSTETTDLVLYKRIAEVKANERKKALEEILCALVVRKFMDANVSLVPSVTPSPPTYSAQDDKLNINKDRITMLMLNSCCWTMFHLWLIKPLVH
ncbi:putative UV-B-induced protein [Helianthus anomalus]